MILVPYSAALAGTHAVTAPSATSTNPGAPPAKNAVPRSASAASSVSTAASVRRRPSSFSASVFPLMDWIHDAMSWSSMKAAQNRAAARSPGSAGRRHGRPPAPEGKASSRYSTMTCDSQMGLPLWMSTGTFLCTGLEVRRRSLLV
uniref:Gst40 n=1 Tax=Arundo donax TaxID=35708 RepID=A0A0A9E2D7_ARUDO